uniref:Polyprotein n=1 Tax=Suizhou Dicis tick virus 1 TaxID=2972098 RepID=A0A9E8AD32_9VIRU|nr:MAG: polyprotein [Suizhou Dicis tick virus 1]
MENQDNQNTLTQPNSSHNLNTVFLEQRAPLEESSLLPGIVHQAPDSSLSVSDPKTLQTTTLFTKPILVRQVQWEVAQAVGTNVVNFTLPGILTDVDSPALGLLSIHALYRSGFKFRIQVNSSPFHSGRLIAWFDPYGLAITDSSLATPSKTGLPHVFIDAANATVGHLEIPFLTLKDFFTTYASDGDCRIGNFYLSVFNQLRVGTGGSTAVSVSIWLEPISVELAVPVMRHTVELQMENALSSIGTPILNALSPLLRTVDGAAGGLLGNTVSMLNGALGSSPSGKGKGKDRPEIPAPQNLGLCYSVPNISNGTGLNPSDRLALLPLITEVDEHESSKMTSGDEMDLLVIAKTPMLMGTINWTDAQTPGTVLKFIPVQPTVVTITSEQGNDYVHPTYLAYVSDVFKFWRGSIRYRFEIPATQHHTGRLMVTWIPNDYVNYNNGNPQSTVLPAPTIQQLSQYPCEVFDLALNKEFEFTVPYNSPTRYKFTPGYYPFAGLPEDVDLQQDYCLGTLYLTVQNSLTHPGTVSDNVDINIFVAGGADYDLRAVKQSSVSQPLPTTVYTYPVTEIQSDVMSLEATRSGLSEKDTNRIGVTPAVIPQDTMQGTDKETHLKFLLSRYYPSHIWSNNIPSKRIWHVQYSVSPTVYSVTNNYEYIPQDLFTYFARLYRFYTGGINFMFIHNTTVNDPFITYALHNYTNYDPVSAPYAYEDARTVFEFADQPAGDNLIPPTIQYANANNIRVNPTICVTAPYRSIYPKLLSDLGSLGDSQLPDAYIAYTSGTVDVYYYNTSENTKYLETHVYKGAGDDFRFYYLIQPPRLRWRPTPA